MTWLTQLIDGINNSNENRIHNLIPLPINPRDQIKQQILSIAFHRLDKY